MVAYTQVGGLDFRALEEEQGDKVYAGENTIKEITFLKGGRTTTFIQSTLSNKPIYFVFASNT